MKRSAKKKNKSFKRLEIRSKNTINISKNSVRGLQAMLGRKQLKTKRK